MPTISKLLDITVVIKVPNPFATPSPKPSGPWIRPRLGASKISKNPWAMDDAYPVGFPKISKLPKILNILLFNWLKYEFVNCSPNDKISVNTSV